MAEMFKFGRLDSTSTVPGLSYDSRPGHDADFSSNTLAMRDAGAHWSVSIKNFATQDLLLVNSLRTQPKRIARIEVQDRFLNQDSNHFVVVELRHREIERQDRGGGKVTSQKVITIRCPEHYLQTHSLFVEELGFYLCLESRRQATLETLAQDIRSPDAREVSVTPSMIKPDPKSTFSDYGALVKNAIKRADRIQVRVGVRVDKDPSRVEDYVRDMRIAVLDQWFSPLASNRMVYDPTLSEDEFVIENLHFVTSEPFHGTFSGLHHAHDRAYYIDTEEHQTMRGTLCGLAIFADPDALQEYLISHQCDELYDILTHRLVDRSGSHALSKRIESLNTQVSSQVARCCELEEALKFERGQVKDLKRANTMLEESIKKIKSHHDESLGAGAVLYGLENERRELVAGRERLEFDRSEFDRKMKAAEANHKASVLKSVADGFKSVWGLVVAVVGAATVLIGWWNKRST